MCHSDDTNLDDRTNSVADPVCPVGVLSRRLGDLDGDEVE